MGSGEATATEEVQGIPMSGRPIQTLCLGENHMGHARKLKFLYKPVRKSGCNAGQKKRNSELRIFVPPPLKEGAQL